MGIEPTLEELDKKMREAETDSHEGKRKVEALWPIFKIHHQRSRYIFDLFYRRKAISRELYDYCLKERYADANLIAVENKDTKISAVSDVFKPETPIFQLIAFVEYQKPSLKRVKL